LTNLDVAHTDSPVTMKAQALLLNRSLLSLAFAGALGVVAAPAAAQPAPPPPPVAPATAAAAPTMAPANADPIAQALAPRPGGLTPEEVARVAARTKHSVRAKQEDLKAAAAKVDQALVTFFPRVSVGASITRLSNIPTPPLTFGTMTFPNPFTPILNNYSLTASIAVPVSDYVLRLTQGYASASHNEKSARLAADAESLQAAADAKISYFNWVRAKGGVVVAAEAVEQARAHVEDAKKAFNVGLASRADVLRIEAQLAAAQQSHAEALAFDFVAEEQLRVVLGAAPERVLEIGADVLHDGGAAPAETLQALQDQAMSRRLEIRALDETIYSLKAVESLTKASYAPRIDAFADATYANPNQRIVPARDAFDGTWDVGVRLSWTLNDTFTTLGAAAEAKARVASVNEQKGALRDGLRLEVSSAYADSIKAPPTIDAADRGMVAAEESLRVRRELFRNGKATSSELVDAEAELTRARLRRLDAHVGQLVARARLDHATGRDVPARPVGEAAPE
jgi:outer membrane protein TolC